MTPAADRRRRLPSGLALLAPLLLCALAGPRHAAAAYTARGIEVDGDYEDLDGVGAEDWFPGFPPMSDPIGSADDTLCSTSPAPKNDILSSFLANDFDYLWVGMERLTNNGNTSLFFSFDITGDGPSVGDFIFVFCYGSGAVVTETYVLEWDPALGEWVRDGTPPEVVFDVNETTVRAPFGTLDERGNPSATIGPGRFAEARITLADIEGFDVCLADRVTGEIQSKSSCSLSSECKDTTGPFTFSFEPITVALEVSQPPDCSPVLVAQAHVESARGGVTYRWFLDGEEITDRDPSWATSDLIRIDLDDECGAHEVSVVADDGRCTAEDAATADVNRRPVAQLAGLSVGACDLTLTYDGTASTDCNGTDLAYLWDFDGDGRPDATGPSGTWTFPDCGPRTVTLVVSDGACLSEPVQQLVHVNEPPAAVLTVVPGSCLAVDWTAATPDCDLLRPSPLYTESLTTSLDVGDGSPPETAPAGRHEYEACGTYLLTLTVTDASGCTATDLRTVTFTGVLTVD